MPYCPTAIFRYSKIATTQMISISPVKKKSKVTKEIWNIKDDSSTNHRCGAFSEAEIGTDAEVHN